MRPPAGRVADGVGDQVLQHLLEPPLVAGDDLGAGSDVAIEPDVAIVERPLMARVGPLEQAGKRHGLALERSAAAFEAGQIEQVADDGLEPQASLR